MPLLGVVVHAVGHQLSQLGAVRGGQLTFFLIKPLLLLSTDKHTFVYRFISQSELSSGQCQIWTRRSISCHIHWQEERAVLEYDKYKHKNKHSVW